MCTEFHQLSGFCRESVKNQRILLPFKILVGMYIILGMYN